MMERPPAIGDFRLALTRVLARNAETGKGPTSIRSLAAALAAEEPNGDEATHRKTEGWRRRIRRYMNGDRGYNRETISRIATAANAQPEEFPAARETMRQRVERLERENRELLERLARHQEHP